MILTGILLLFSTLSMVTADLDDTPCSNLVGQSCPRHRITRCCGGVSQGSYVVCTNSLAQSLQRCRDPSLVCRNIPSGVGVECVKIVVVPGK